MKYLFARSHSLASENRLIFNTLPAPAPRPFEPGEKEAQAEALAKSKGETKEKPALQSLKANNVKNAEDLRKQTAAEDLKDGAAKMIDASQKGGKAMKGYTLAQWMEARRVPVAPVILRGVAKENVKGAAKDVGGAVGDVMRGVGKVIGGVPKEPNKLPPEIVAPVAKTTPDIPTETKPEEPASPLSGVPLPQEVQGTTRTVNISGEKKEEPSPHAKKSAPSNAEAKTEKEKPEKAEEMKTDAPKSEVAEVKADKPAEAAKEAAKEGEPKTNRERIDKRMDDAMNVLKGKDATPAKKFEAIMSYIGAALERLGHAFNGTLDDPPEKKKDTAGEAAGDKKEKAADAKAEKAPEGEKQTGRRERLKKEMKDGNKDVDGLLKEKQDNLDAKNKDIDQRIDAKDKKIDDLKKENTYLEAKARDLEQKAASLSGEERSTLGQQISFMKDDIKANEEAIKTQDGLRKKLVDTKKSNTDKTVPDIEELQTMKKDAERGKDTLGKDLKTLADSLRASAVEALRILANMIDTVALNLELNMSTLEMQLKNSPAIIESAIKYAKDNHVKIPEGLTLTKPEDVLKLLQETAKKMKADAEKK